jgi:probable rRNA maturation factor
MLKLEISNSTKDKLGKKFFEDLVVRFEKIMKKRVVEYLGKRDGAVDLVLVGDCKIRSLNRDYRKKDKVTDVISFAYLEVTDYVQAPGDVIVGDIFISIPTAKRQAKGNKHSLKKELEVLFVHGMLHLFGFDHNNDAEEKEMEGWAKKITS